MLLVLAIIALVAFPSGLLASSIQVCKSYYIPSVTLNPGYIYCQTADDKDFQCLSNSCGDVKSHYFVNCAKQLPQQKLGAYKMTVYYMKFTAADDAGYLDATDFYGGSFRCPTGPAHPHNQIRPRCTSCDPRIG
ncbi:hypothetical protein MJO29_016666 [Puccinia striiformis f. sp. tritici]|uniref:Secreted protein n=1 Tax=Puccinia striiformis f. sp. tritici PST-78 TaxID=1165861 RepID=A0A0L0VFU4_9BASI|nr:hypothetical protein MJO29_016666 [Puccinia striiformis f. sp. tritici]KAI9600979.1 hypothetical protein H4Q26_000773 [Puccinia striiformis f. sp. tritici PST-130]KNE98162.1 hypothetical protein PSTG_08626 [Puccinia striiformis f. sp. tritici PST-78]